MTSFEPQIIKRRTALPICGESRPALLTRRHTDLPLGSRSVQESRLTSEDEAEYESARVLESGFSPRSGSPRRRSPSSHMKRASLSQTAGPSSVATLHTNRRSFGECNEELRLSASHGNDGVLSYLDPDSPHITAEIIKYTLEASTQWHREPKYSSARSSSTSSTSSSTGKESLWGRTSERDTDTGAQPSPETSVDGEITLTTFVQHRRDAQIDGPRSNPKSEDTSESKPGRTRTQVNDTEYRYGTPEMPRGKADLPHIPPNALTPRAANRGQGHVKHLPRAEKLPLTGYELLAARLTAGSGRGTSRPRRHGRPQPSSSQPPSPSNPGHTDRCGSPEGAGMAAAAHHQPDAIKPIYRRFEALNHRLLLHLQDELSELEEQLHRLDTADTQTRRLRGGECILPASRRAGRAAGGELQWHKTDTLGKIGFKLGQYNHALASFRAARDLPPPEAADVEAYRTYLATDSPIAEIETRFLDPADDLVCLAREDEHRSRSGSSCGSSVSSGSSSSYGHRKGGYDPATMSDEAPTPRPGSLAGPFPKPTPRFPFVGAPGGAFLPTPSLSPASSVGGCSRPPTRSGAAEDAAPSEALPPQTSAFGLTYALSVGSILLPLIIFSCMNGFAARLAIVLVLSAVAGVVVQGLAQADWLGQPQRAFRLGNKDTAAYIGAYGAVVAMAAALC